MKLDKSIKLMWSVNYCLRINRYWRAYSSVEYRRNEKQCIGRKGGFYFRNTFGTDELPNFNLKCRIFIEKSEMQNCSFTCHVLSCLCLFYSFSQNLPFIIVLITLMGVIRITKCQPGESENLTIILFQSHLCQFMLSYYLKFWCQSCD